MKKYIYKYVSICFAIALLQTSCYSKENFLEVLWEQAKQNNHSLQAAKNNALYASNVYQYRHSILYPVSLSTILTSNFNDAFKQIEWYTTETEATVTLNKNLPGGLSVAGIMNYNITKGFLNPYISSTNDDITGEDIGYTHIPALSLQLSQSLKPFWLQGIIYDPNANLLKENLTQQQINFQLVEKELIQQITHSVIELRQTNRLVDITEKQVAFYDEYVSAMRENHLQGIDSAYDVWKADEKRWDCVQSLNNYYRTKQETQEALRFYCGQSFNSNVMGELPQNGNPLYIEDLDNSLVQSQLKELHDNYVIEKQNNAPVLSLKGTIAESTKIQKEMQFDYAEERDYLSWAFTVSLDFSQIGYKKNRLQKEQYQNSVKEYHNQLEDIEKQKEMNNRTYESLIAIYTTRVEKSKEIMNNRKQYVKDVEQEVKNGVCSLLELMSSQNEYEMAVCMLENDKDLLWYYTWLKVQNN